MAAGASRLSAVRNLLQGNLIGVSADGGKLGNASDGVYVNSVYRRLDWWDDSWRRQRDRTQPGHWDRPRSRRGDSPFFSNSIFDNTGLGIDILGNRVTPNDPGDADSGPNNVQNYPVITSATISGGNTTIVGTLNSTPNSTFLVQFFGNTDAGAFGFGEGENLARVRERADGP